MAHRFTFLFLTALLALSPSIEAWAQNVELDKDKSWIVAITEREGLLGFLGHRHGIIPTKWSADLCVTTAKPSESMVVVEIPTESLAIDTSEALSRAGQSDGPSDSQRKELQEKMLSSRFLAASEHPIIRFELSSIDVSKEPPEAKGSIRIRGKEKAVSFPVHYTLKDTFQAHGVFFVDHTDFEMQPESVAGVVKVANKIELKFHLEGRVTKQACTK